MFDFFLPLIRYKEDTKIPISLSLVLFVNEDGERGFSNSDDRFYIRCGVLFLSIFQVPFTSFLVGSSSKRCLCTWTFTLGRLDDYNLRFD